MHTGTKGLSNPSAKASREFIWYSKGGDLFPFKSPFCTNIIKKQDKQ